MAAFDKGYRIKFMFWRSAETHKRMLEMGEVMADAVVCGWKDSNYTTKGTPGWAQQNCDNYVCQCGFFLLISFRAVAYE